MRWIKIIHGDSKRAGLIIASLVPSITSDWRWNSTIYKNIVCRAARAYLAGNIYIVCGSGPCRPVEYDVVGVSRDIGNKGIACHHGGLIIDHSHGNRAIGGQPVTIHCIAAQIVDSCCVQSKRLLCRCCTCITEQSRRA